ncbi:MAG: hypothetical protein GY796_33280 [Chloroflexi bacterium]|nr:hypothetical protein [Chloroflexota bacterium]
MLQQKPILLLITFFILVSLACNAFSGDVEPAAELPPPVISSTLVPGTAVPIEGAAPTVTLPGGTEIAQETAAPPIEGAFITVLVDLNVRSGPSVQYDRVGFLLQNETAPIIGQDPTSGWWKIECPPSVLEAIECWLSGGAQYSAAANTEGIPVAIVPPTPTSPPTNTPTPSPVNQPDGAGSAGGLLVYSDQNGLWLLSLNTEQSPPQAGEPQQLVSGGNFSGPLLSPDGQKVAYLSGDTATNTLNIINVDGSSDRTLIQSADIPAALSKQTVGSAILIDQIAWLPDSQLLAYSSRLDNLTGPGSQPQADLWTVTLDGSITPRFRPGEGGHTFAISPSGIQVIFSLPESIVQANMDGSNRQTVFDFAFVNTASEYAYVPVVQWLADGSTVTAVSNPDPWQPEANAALYLIQNGAASALGTVPGNILFSPIQWQSTAAQLAYVQFIPDDANNQTLLVADGRGQNPQPYHAGDNLQLWGWNEGNGRFLYSGDGFMGIGQPAADAVEFALPAALRDAQWLNNIAFIMNLGSGASWNLTAANLSGDTALLATASGNLVDFDTWTP